MGSAYYALSYPGNLTQTEVSNKVAEDSAGMAYDSGHSYSGNWGAKQGAGVIFPVGHTFKNHEEATRYIQDQSDKWGPLIAVRFQNLVEELPEKRKAKHDELRDQWLELDRARREYPRQVLERVRTGSSAFKTCSGCGSRLAVARMSSLNCPLCDSNLMLTGSDIKKLASMQSKLDKLLKAREDLRISVDKGVQWLVGGWCPS